MIKASSLAARCLLALGVGLCVLLLAELGWRGWYAWRARPYQARATAERIEEIAASMLQRAPRSGNPAPESGVEFSTPLLHPYVGFEDLGSLRSFDALVRELSRLRRAERYDICVLGGSLAAGFAGAGAHRLSARLMRDPRFAGVSVRVHGLARGAHKQPQQALMLSWLFARGARPDAVIELDGFNEVAVASHNIENEIPPLAPALAQWMPLAGLGGLSREEFDMLLQTRRLQRQAQQLLAVSRRLGCARSALAGNFVLRRMHGLRLESAMLQARLMSAVRTPQALQPVDVAGTRGLHGSPFESALQAWFEGSLSLASLCDKRGILYLHALQPTLHDAGSKPTTEEELRSGGMEGSWLTGVREGYPRLRELGQQLRARDVAFVDLSDAFRDHPETLYVDACHIGTAGNLLLADRIAAALLAQLGPDFRAAEQR